MAGVVLEGVSRVYPGGVAAVRDLHLRIPDGELFVLLGPSGSGKTTTLRLIAGLETPDSGEISIGDRAVNRLAPRQRNIAMVFQHHALYPHLSAYENMAFGLRLRDGSGWLPEWLQRAARRLVPTRAAADARRRVEIDHRVREAAGVLGIEELLARPAWQLSGGEQQRVALGRAIVRQPAAFLLDEPLSNLDPLLRVETRSELKRLHEQLETTMLYVTHDQVEAMTLGQRLAVMDAGRLRQVGSPREVYDQPRDTFVARFLGSPAINLVRGRIQREPDALLFQTDGWSLAADVDGELAAFGGREVTLGIRPEDVALQGAESAGPGAAAGAAVAATVVSLESLGEAQVARLRPAGAPADAAPLTARMSPAARLARGDAVQLTIDLRRAHLFDAAEGHNLRTAENN